jgi:apolipoprotein D and lipocalin family protein
MTTAQDKGARLALLITASLVLAGCKAGITELDTVDRVDLDRFMGDWYVIANIPTVVEKGAHNAVESYRLDEDGSIATTFTFRKNTFDGPEKQYRPRGFVRNTQSNAEWGMQFIWPFKSDYRVIYLDPDYSTTVIGRNKRDYVWIMSRAPAIDPAEYAEILHLVADAGYDISRIEQVPQQW